MQVRKVFVTLILILFVSNVLTAQTYYIKSFEGKIVKVKLYYKTFSKKLVVSCSNDSLFLFNYTGVQDVRIFKNRFIKIEYNVLGGPDIVNRNTLILSVYKNSIVTSMLVNSRFEGFSTNKYILYNVKINPIVDTHNNYQIQANVSEIVRFNENASLNSHSNRKIILKFDDNHKVFYSNIEHLSKYFMIFKPDDSGETIKKRINGEIPSMSLGKKYNYLYINYCWYLSGVQHKGLIPDSLISNSYKSNPIR